MAINSDMQEYYDRRAPVYENIYDFDDPIRRKELDEIESELIKAAAGQSVLEIACGSGYWTNLLAPVAPVPPVALKVSALDASKQMLEIARARGLDPARVSFLLADAYDLPDFKERFTLGLAAFWLSHVPRARVSEFLDGFQRRLTPGALVFLFDNHLVRGMGGELLAPKGDPNTYKIRKLPDGSRYQVVKNYYDERSLRETLSDFGSDIRTHVGSVYWWATYHAGA
ncbi:MAG: class I SAM-dependent methyltransferase [Candidatus Zixiibacteriota bacterium]